MRFSEALVGPPYTKDWDRAKLPCQLAKGRMCACRSGRKEGCMCAWRRLAINSSRPGRVDLGKAKKAPNEPSLIRLLSPCQIRAKCKKMGVRSDPNEPNFDGHWREAEGIAAGSRTRIRREICGRTYCSVRRPATNTVNGSRSQGTRTGTEKKSAERTQFDMAIKSLPDKS